MVIEIRGREYEISDDQSVIYGRPDLHGALDYGVTEATSFPPYVFSVGYTSCLMHKIASVEMRWWTHGGPGGECMVRLMRPRMFAQTVCGVSKTLTAKRVRTCRVPEPDAWLCGRCHGDVATFGKHGKATKAGVTRSQAHVKLGCVITGYGGRSEASLAEDAVDPHVSSTGTLSARDE